MRGKRNVSNPADNSTERGAFGRDQGVRIE